MPAPKNMSEVAARFGKLTISGDKVGYPANWKTENLVTIRLPGTGWRVSCNRAIAWPLKQVFTELTEKGLLKHIHTFDGCFCPRPIRGSKNISLHAWALAVDFNAAENPLGSKGKMNLEVVKIFEKYGFTWGGSFRHRKDPMHFQYCDN